MTAVEVKGKNTEKISEEMKTDMIERITELMVYLKKKKKKRKGYENTIGDNYMTQRTLVNKKKVR